MKTKLILSIVLILLATACSRLTQDNYEKLKPGMTYDEVTQILGRPANCNDLLGMKNCTWGDEQHNISANFMGGKAILHASQNIR